MRLKAFLYLLISQMYLTVFTYAQEPDITIDILYLNSYDARMSWPREILRGIEDRLEPDRNNYNLHIEHMDSKEFPTREQLDAFREYLAIKYARTDLSLILASDNNAFFFLRDNHDTLFPSVPVVFSGVNNFEDWLIDGYPDFTGVAEIFSAENTVDLALKLHPETEQIYIINDYLNTGRAWRRDLEQRLKYLENRVHLQYSENLPLPELRKKIASLPKNTIILLGVYYSDSDGKYSTYEKSGTLLVSASRVPVYCLAEFNIASGAIGGQLIWGYAHGTKMAELGIRILEGESPGDIPVVKEGMNRYVFNYPQLKRFSLSLKDLPVDSIIVNRPFSVMQEYKQEIILTLVMVSILIIITIALSLTVIRKHQVERTLRDLADATWEGIVIHTDGIAVQFNKVFLDMFGYGEDEIMGRNFLSLVCTPLSLKELEKRVKKNMMEPYEMEARKKDGTVFPVEVRLRRLGYRGQNVRVAAIRDLSEQRNIETQALEAQKLQAIGTLAGGIAHDFNNILSAVVGYSDLGQMISEPDSDFYKYFQQILTAGKRAKELTSQILAFSRQGGNEKKSVNFSVIIKDTLGMLKASLPSNIIIDQHVNEAVCVLSDPAQLQQIVMNLGTNAGLAMEESGGTLYIGLREVHLTEPTTVSLFTLVPGSYAELIVRDTGCGMTEETVKRIYEPFYTTRSQGGGTGLGLSVVHGIVSKQKGAVKVDSRPAEGSQFTIYLPSCDKGSLFFEHKHPAVLEGGSERILFVDDEVMQVNLAYDLLKPLGYSVTGVTSSVEAYNLFAEGPDAFDLVITDVSMPEIPGDLLVEKIRAVREDIPVLMCTGYSSRITDERIQSLKISHLLMKPLVMRDFAEQIRRALME